MKKSTGGGIGRRTLAMVCRGQSTEPLIAQLGVGSELPLVDIRVVGRPDYPSPKARGWDQNLYKNPASE